MEETKCPYCGGVRRRQVFWEGAFVTCLKCGAHGEYEYGRWHWSRAHLTKRPPDAGDSAASSDSLPASEVSALQGESTPAPRR